jgi:hypothetical protein
MNKEAQNECLCKLFALFKHALTPDLHGGSSEESPPYLVPLSCPVGALMESTPIYTS